MAKPGTLFTVTPSNQDWTDYDAAQATLTAAFELVEPTSHWKDAICCFVPEGADLAVVAEAIIHFTATVPTFEVTGGGIVVRAAGYRAGPAGDN